MIALHAINNGVDLKIFGKGSAEKSEIEEAVKVLEESGSIDYAQELAFSYIQEGKEKLKVLPDSDSKATLLEIADYMIERKY